MSLARQIIQDHLRAVEALFGLTDAIEAAGRTLSDSLARDGKILLCGNGGSASDAQHIAAELVGRFRDERPALAAVALTTDTSILTSVGNDYGFEQIFARQTQALARPGDVFVAISTSGNSANVVAATRAARALGCKTVGLLGRDGGVLGGLVDQAVVVPDPETARIQEGHILVGHIWCAMIDAALKEGAA